MFRKVDITEFKEDLPNLIYGDGMFSSSSVTKFKSSVPKLKYADGMFSNLKKFRI